MATPEELKSKFWKALKSDMTMMIGLDGIAVESINPGRVPIDVMGAEFGGFIKSIRLSNTELNTGDVHQFSLVTDKYVVFVSEVTPEYYVLLVTAPDRYSDGLLTVGIFQ